MNIPRCEACDELIFSSEYTAAEDRFWHLKHFCCWVCDLPLAGHQYIPVDGVPHCLQCWQDRHGKTCSTCHLTIHPQDQRVSLGEQSWHARPECFRCGVCASSLIGRLNILIFHSDIFIIQTYWMYNTVSIYLYN